MALMLKIKDMTMTHLVMFRMKAILKFLVSTMEMATVMLVINGSQSDLTNYFICFIYAQMIFRFYEILAIPAPNFNLSVQVCNILSTSSMLLFIQMTYMLTTSLPFHSEKLQMVKLYTGQGEICNLMSYWQAHRFMLIISYFGAVILKLINLHQYIKYEIEFQAKYRSGTVEDIQRERYLEFFKNTLRQTENSTCTFFNCFECCVKKDNHK